MEITIIQVSLIVTVLLSLVFYVFMTYFSTLSRKDGYLSFADGLIISFFILEFLPTLFYDGDKLASGNIFFVYFWGFIIFHIVEKYIFYFTKEIWNVEVVVNKLNLVLFVLQLFAFGFLLVFTAKMFGNYALFGLVVIVLFIWVTSKSFKINELFEKSILSFKYKKFITLSLFLGGFFAYFIDLGRQITFLFYSFCFGMLLYISIRDSMDHKRKINPVYFLLGNIVAIFLIFLKGILFG